MRHIKLLLSISLFFIFTTKVFAQVNVIENTRFLKINFANQPPPNDRFATIDTLNIISTVNNTVKFKLTTSDVHFYSVGAETYIVNGSDTTLLYDYSLQVNDTFEFNGRMNETDTFIVDSVLNKTLQDNKTYKHWYLSNLRKEFNLVWVQNFGEKYLGWDYSKYYLPDYNGIIKSICSDNNLIFWNSDFNGFEPRHISQTCSFDSLKQLLSVITPKIFKIIPYPNPAYINLKIDGIEEGTVKIFNSIGQLVLEVSFEKIIDISNLPNGIYQIAIYEQDKLYRGNFIKE